MSCMVNITGGVFVLSGAFSLSNHKQNMGLRKEMLKNMYLWNLFS